MEPKRTAHPGALLAAELGAADLAGGGLREVRGEVEDAGVLVGSGEGFDVVLELVAEGVGGGGRVAEDDNGADDGAAFVVGGGDGGGLGDGWMRHEGGLDLEGADAVAARDDDVVGAALEEEVAVVV